MRALGRALQRGLRGSTPGWILLVLPASLGLVACGAATPLGPVTSSGPGRPSASPNGPSTTTSPLRVSIPPDGIALAAYGYGNGPVRQFSLPRGAVLVSKVDQANNVAAVLSRPAPEAVADYLRRALPAAGFTIGADDRATLTLTFSGHGWTGDFTAGNGTSAVLLRPS